MRVRAVVVFWIFLPQVQSQGCPPNCMRCYNRHNCAECVAGFYIGQWYDDDRYPIKNDCSLKCNENCAACSSYSKCTKCKAGFCNRDGIGTCQDQCNHRCQACSSCEVCTSCKAWRYGLTCSLECGEGCVRGICEFERGNCNCSKNFRGAKCDTCIAGKYGPNCGVDCPEGCKANTCDRNNGTCHTCLGYKCDTSCHPGKYGPSCSNNCPKGCKGKKCDKENGLCLDGCQPGYRQPSCRTCFDGFYGDKCDSCIAGKYGSYCSLDCPRGCNGNICQKAIGQCTRGCRQGYKQPNCSTCKDGFHGTKCDPCPKNCLACNSATYCSKCKDGFWGETCQEICPQSCISCVSESKCLKCVVGYYGKKCNKCPTNCEGGICAMANGWCEACKTGFWGKHCEVPCSQGCYRTNCDIDNGRCLGECKLGFTGEKCESCTNGFYGLECFHCPKTCAGCISEHECTSCVNGYHGLTCSQECPAKCHGQTCEQETGFCLSCNQSYYGDNCELSCSSRCKSNECKRDGKCLDCIDGFYGDKCLLECPDNCKGKCIQENGHCTGCTSDHFGDRCELLCPKNCKNGTNCRQSDGYCLDGCADGLYGIMCNIKCSPQCKSCHRNSYLRCTSCAHGKYGKQHGYLNCNKYCSKTCLNKICDEENGRCTNGCEKGFIGMMCKRRCNHFDTACEECVAKTDDQYKGCLVCKKGFYPSTEHSSRARHNQCVLCPSDCIQSDCDTKNGFCLHGCVKGKWGELCDKTCASYCLACNQINGDCFSCINGTYGVNCSRNCSYSCAASCDKNTGECISGCEKNRYGTYCEKKCSLNCWNEECDWETGYCRSGCVHGFSGKFCNTPCNKNCKDNSCNWLSGDCDVGCSDGFEGGQCAQEVAEQGNVLLPVGIGVGILVAITIAVVIVSYINHRKRKKNTRAKEMTDMNRSENKTNQGEEVLCEGNRNDVQAAGQGYIYALPNKLGKEQRPKSGTERKAIATVEVERGGRSQQCQSTGLQGAEYANIRNEHTFVSTDNTGHEYKSTNDEKLTCALNDDFEKEEYFDDDEEHKTTIAQQDCDDTYYNTAAVSKRRIQLDKLAEFISNKTKEDFISEFKMLPVGLTKPYKVSQTAENRPKNRYREVLPYDTRRVVIKTGDSDYINASYIDGYMRKNAYIASMGPTAKHMGNDFAVFWEMIWQENVNTIVMLTKLKESGTQKCDKYWPDKGSRDTYGNLQVTCRTEDIYTHFTVRTFSMENVNCKNERRTLHHMHFTSWPDKGVPEKVSLLTEFHEQTTSKKSSLTNGPLLVHCSAGVGRTGTYIALDMLTNEGRSEGHVDIFACVRNLREERMNMVQTVEQYIYLHECLVHVLKNTSKKKGGNKC